MAPAMRLKATRTTAAAQRAFACARQQALRAQASRHHVVRVSAVDGETAVVDTPKKEGGRKPGPLERGGTLSGDAALGKDPSGAIKAKMGGAGSDDGDAAVFSDARWIGATCRRQPSRPQQRPRSGFCSARACPPTLEQGGASGSESAALASRVVASRPV